MRAENTDRGVSGILATLFLSRSLVTAAIIAMAVVRAIIATEMTGNSSLAGVPSAVHQFAAAGSAYIWGLLWGRIGRRRGLAVAVGMGFLGAAIATIAIESGSFLLFLIGVVAGGAAEAGARLSRFIASDVSIPDIRGRAISIVVWGGTIGAIGGPLLVDPSGAIATSLGLNELSGPIAVAMPLFLIAVAIVLIGLRREPSLVASMAKQEPAESRGVPRLLGQLLKTPGVFVAIIVVVLSQSVMVMLMVITSLHMTDLGHSLADISLVFMAHTIGMFAFSPITGRMTDTIGRGPTMVAGSAITILSAIIAPASPEVLVIAIGLFLLGLGWNFCFVAGSALLADQLSVAERTKTQGANDLIISLGSGAGSLSSGVVYASLGYSTVASAGGLLMLGALGLSIWWIIKTARSEPVLEH
jgi:MFS family permease